MNRIFFTGWWLLVSAAVALGFQSKAEPDSVTRIALVSDLHTTRPTNDTQQLHWPRLEQVIAQVNAAGVDLVLVAGDLTEHGQAHEMEALKARLRGFKAKTWHVPGNHDLWNKDAVTTNKPAVPISWRLRYYERALGRSFYCRTHAGVRVVAVNAPLVGSGLRREQVMWRMLERELSKPSPLPTVVLSHYPPFAKKPEEKSAYWNFDPEPRRRFLDLVKQGAARAVLAGHLHQEQVAHYGEIPVVVSTPVAFDTDKKKNVVGWTLVTIPAAGPVQVQFQHLPQ